MSIYVVLTVLCGSLLSLVVYLANKSGSRAAQLEAIKEELRRIGKEQAKADEINQNLASLNADAARRKLCELQSKQRNRMQ